ncbi:hypothetical protein CgunFtcFv8_024274 [Champsocephalus gunnari]|uniref:Uncharacterized protein n=1 Tax=Champsocephalus gunnari TaxID=52237 RepID=A0AAN8HLP5_CHAGU|nr:hypothetical protein CgunFtcFv8_024274 [Champsocephalus gunnari]
MLTPFPPNSVSNSPVKKSAAHSSLSASGVMEASCSHTTGTTSMYFISKHVSDAPLIHSPPQSLQSHAGTSYHTWRRENPGSSGDKKDQPAPERMDEEEEERGVSSSSLSSLHMKEEEQQQQRRGREGGAAVFPRCLLD